MRSLLLTFALVLLFFGTVEGSPAAPLEPLDSTGYVYEFDMKYIGSNYHIDMNYQYVLGYLIEILNADQRLKLHIRGHVCCGPSYKLSKKRAKKVYQYLKAMGIDRSRMTYKGYSDSIPIAFPEKTEEDQAKNRRVDFILYTLD